MKIQNWLITVIGVLFLVATAGISSAAEPMACEDLATLVLPDSTINVAELITDGTYNLADGYTTYTDLPVFCRVALTVAPTINVEVWLPLPPQEWNKRLLGFGGGGFDGIMFYYTPEGGGALLQAGYAVANTDGGHTGGWDVGHPAVDGRFALNPDGTLNWGLIEDFAYRARHEMTVKAKAVIEAFYGEAPSYSYFYGQSTGGRQALALAQRFPDDYDGIVCQSPVHNWDRLYPAEFWPNIVMKEEVGQPIESCKFTTFNAAALAACDGLDGLVDGAIDDTRRCNFDPQTLLCAADVTPDCNCLTAGEATSIRKILEGPRTSSNEFLYYGLEPGASFTTVAGDKIFGISDFYLKYWLHKDPAFDWHTLDYSGFEQDFRDTQEVFNSVMGSDNPDLSGFRDSSGKIIIAHGWQDNCVFPRGTIEYWERVQTTTENVNSFARLYMAPGLSHGPGGTGPDVFDMLSPLVNWVENGVAPDKIIATRYVNTDPAQGVDRTRPLCPYPEVARYVGKGSIDEAENFTCVTIVPAQVNLKQTKVKVGKGSFVADMTIPEGYSFNKKQEIAPVVSQGAKAINTSLTKKKTNLAARFNMKDVIGITPGDAVPFTITANFSQGGKNYALEGTDTVKVLEK